MSTPIKLSDSLWDTSLQLLSSPVVCDNSDFFNVSRLHELLDDSDFSGCDVNTSKDSGIGVTSPSGDRERHLSPASTGIKFHRPWLSDPKHGQDEDARKLTSNPLFTDLQAALQRDCENGTVPAPAALVSTVQPASSPLSIVVRVNLLRARMMTLLKASGNDKVVELQHFYQAQSVHLETARCAAVQTLHYSDQWLIAALHVSYDQLHHSLLDRVEQSLTMVEQLVRDAAVTDIAAACKARQPSAPSLVAQPSATAVVKPCDNVITNGCNTAGTTGSHRSTRKGPLNSLAVRIMTNWYRHNQEHPYPS